MARMGTVNKQNRKMKFFSAGYSTFYNINQIRKIRYLRGEEKPQTLVEFVDDQTITYPGFVDLDAPSSKPVGNSSVAGIHTFTSLA
jgi:hypothetical protein